MKLPPPVENFLFAFYSASHAREIGRLNGFKLIGGGEVEATFVGDDIAGTKYDRADKEFVGMVIAEVQEPKLSLSEAFIKDMWLPEYYDHYFSEEPPLPVATAEVIESLRVAVERIWSLPPVRGPFISPQQMADIQQCFRLYPHQLLDNQAAFGGEPSFNEAMDFPERE